MFRRPLAHLALLAALACVGAEGCSTPSPAAGRPSRLSLSPCQLASPGRAERVAARCGTLEVFEDRAARSGKTIALKVAVVAATGTRTSPDPLFLLAGGPGQSITEVFPEMAPAFARVNIKRDLVLVDQRGTGGSNPLRCPGSGDEAQGPDEARKQAAACLARLPGDPRHYATAEAMDDLDEVREALGYQSINLWGGSYGTRAALVYLRQHPGRVRSAVLDGVVPVGWPLPVDVARNAQNALDRTLARCEADPACRAAFPDLSASFRALLASVEQKPAQVFVAHPVTGERTAVTVDKAALGMTLRLLSYFSEGVAILPLAIHTAHRTGDLSTLAAQSLLAREALDLAEGMQLSVICSEDDPRVDPALAEARSAGTFTGDSAWKSFRAACSVWPRAPLAPEQASPVSSPAPMLLLSGELDPVTPPETAEAAARTLPNARQLVLAGEAHGVTSRGCMPRVVADFLDRGTAEGLDTSCLADHRPLPFFTSFKGPPP